MNQKELAQILGFQSGSNISRYEAGHTFPDLIAAIKLEISLNAPVSFIFYDLTKYLQKEIIQKSQ